MGQDTGNRTKVCYKRMDFYGCMPKCQVICLLIAYWIILHVLFFCCLKHFSSHEPKAQDALL